MKNYKFSTTPPLIEEENIVNDSREKCNIFNNFFSSKSTVSNFEDPSPNLAPIEGINKLEVLNTSPIEVAKIIRLLKKSSFSHCGVPVIFLMNFFPQNLQYQILKIHPQILLLLRELIN